MASRRFAASWPWGAGYYHVIRFRTARALHSTLKRTPHRGSKEEQAAFASKFVTGRLTGFEKDIRICLTPMTLESTGDETHAYFPALAACCGTLEYFAAMHRGKVDGLGWPDVSSWAQEYLPQPEYDEDTIRVVVNAFRNAVAHRGIASGVWVERSKGGKPGRRLTWKITENAERPPVALIEENGVLTLDPPWPCKYTHRVHIHLASMAADILEGGRKFAHTLAQGGAPLDRFFKCMKYLYPE